MHVIGIVSVLDCGYKNTNLSQCLFSQVFLIWLTVYVSSGKKVTCINP